MQSLNPWNYKPWWCQPWSIILTGIIIIAGSWLLWSRIWLTALFCLPIFVWWFYFLIVWPKLIQSAILEQSNHQEIGS